VHVAAGFDARAAAIVMNVVRAVASAGHTVMVTIHQPSINIFEAFDTLLLLQVSLACLELGSQHAVCLKLHCLHGVTCAQSCEVTVC
jgi:hypothetical protein